MLRDAQRCSEMLRDAQKCSEILRGAQRCSEVLRVIHTFVETLDEYFGNVCELDLIYNFHKAYYILDELILGGHQQEPRKVVILASIDKQDELVEEAKSSLTSVLGIT